MDGAPIELWKYIFSQELRHVKSLNIYTVTFPNNSDYICTLLDLLPNMANCRSLKTLSCFITETYDNPSYGPKFEKLKAAIKQMTWLEYLCIGFADLDYNIGDYFKDHSKLTTLIISNKNTGKKIRP